MVGAAGGGGGSLINFDDIVYSFASLSELMQLCLMMRKE